MAFELSISGISSQECKCNPFLQVEKAVDELIEVIEDSQDQLPFTAEDVSLVRATYHCEGVVESDGVSPRICGLIIDASLHSADGTGLTSTEFISTEIID